MDRRMERRPERIGLSRVFVWLAAGLVFWTSACAPAPAERVARGPESVAALPPVPEVEGPLDIRLAYPPPGARKPDADSTFVFGTTGTGAARLTINGLRVPVAANGAFLAYVPVPRDGTYRFEAEAGGRTDAETFTYAPPPPPRLNVEAFPAPRAAVVIGGRDTLATGSQIAAGSPTPTADRRWFFPKGARLVVTGRLGDQLRVRLAGDTEAWIAASDVALSDSVPPPLVPVEAVSIEGAGRVVDVRIAAAYAPFLVTPAPGQVGITLYGRTDPVAPDVPVNDFVRVARWEASSADSARLVLDLGESLWGFKSFYETDGTLVVRLRRPPSIDPEQPVRGLRILVDPGHPPGGAIGPTGYTEAEANLAVSLRLAEMLRARGADVVMTRASGEPLVSGTDSAAELWARVDLAVAEDADLLVSLHNNAFSDGVNPFLHFGTETYYFYPFSAPLAEALVEAIAAVTGLPDLGAKRRSLALVRPSWMPSTLTESLFMMFPQQEAALRNPAFQERLAGAHLQGIEAFLRASLR